MRFVGIRNGPEKVRLLRDGKSRLTQVPARDVTYDCLRHLQFLEWVEKSECLHDFSETLYWKYLIYTGRTAEVVSSRCQRFLELYHRIRSRVEIEKQFICASVTEDGIRLDGSHRASILCFLGVLNVWVRVYRWEDMFLDCQVRVLREEARIKREVQEQYVGTHAFDPLTEELLVPVVSAGIEQIKKCWLFRKKCLVPTVGLISSTNQLKYFRLERVQVRREKECQGYFHEPSGDIGREVK